MDCSWPMGASLNDGVSKDMYLQQPCELKYPTIDKVARKIYDLSVNNMGEPIYFWKEDLDRVFRQLYANPISIPMLGYKWKGLYYFDTVMMMGCRIAPYVCQCTTDMIVYIHTQAGYYAVNYVDDFLGVEYWSLITKAHNMFITLLDRLRIDRSSKKSVAPTQVIEFIGNLIDAKNMMIGVTPEQNIQVLRELESWHEKTSCT